MTSQGVPSWGGFRAFDAGVPGKICPGEQPLSAITPSHHLFSSAPAFAPLYRAIRRDEPVFSHRACSHVYTSMDLSSESRLRRSWCSCSKCPPVPPHTARGGGVVRAHKDEEIKGTRAKETSDTWISPFGMPSNLTPMLLASSPGMAPG